MAQKTENKGTGLILNRAELIQCFGITPSMLDKWEKQGCPVHEQGGPGKAAKFDTAAVFQWHLQAFPERDKYFQLFEDEIMKSMAEYYRKNPSENHPLRSG